MEEIISMIAANGLWACLFCGLLVYELRDSRRRETRYCGTISALTDRLSTLSAVKADTAAILSESEMIKADTERIKATVCAESPSCV